MTIGLCITELNSNGILCDVVYLHCIYIYKCIRMITGTDFIFKRRLYGALVIIL